jgi:hypothetical protein
MSANSIGYIPKPGYDYTKYTIMSFPSWRALQDFAYKIKEKMPNRVAEQANKNFKTYVENILNGQGDKSAYGLFGKQPKSYDEAMARENFLYYKEYDEIKKEVEKKVQENLAKSSEAEAMKPKLVFNDKQIGDFVYDKAAMSLEPKIYHYNPKSKKEVDILTQKIIYKDDKMYLESDNSLVVFAFKVQKDDGSEIFVEIEGEETLEKANKLGILDCTSTNKKVYLYKEKKPRITNSVKIVVGLTVGGFTTWKNDFYTGITAVILVEVLESLGYSVDVEVALGGGRCGQCDRKLKFNGQFDKGRRFFIFTAKDFNSQLDKDGLLYTLADPSFHNVKFVSLLNYFFTFFGDQIDTMDGTANSSRYSSNGNPAMTWHGIQELDMINPIGMYEKNIDYKKGNKNLFHFYISGYGDGTSKTQIKDKQDVVKAVTDLVLTCENRNLEALKKYTSYDFGENN